MNIETKVGLFVIVCVTIFMSVLLSLGDFTIGRYNDLYINFNDVSGLPPKSKVKMSGVDIGVVKRIDLVEGKARVYVKIKSQVEIHRDCKANIVSTGVIGSKYLEIIRGSSSEPILKDGAVIEGNTPYSMENILDKLMKSVDSFLGGMGGEKEGGITKIIKNLEGITDKLNKGLGENESDVRSIVEDMRDTMASLKSASANIDSLIGNNKQVLQKDIDNLSSALEKMNNIFTKIDSGEGVLGKLISDKESGKDIKETITNLKHIGEDVKNVTSRFRKIKIDWETNMRYNYKDEEWRSDFGIRIRPSESKFYLFRVDNISGEGSPRYDIGDQKTNSVTALVGTGVNNFSFYGGAIKSTAGGGVGYKMLQDKVKLNADIYRFGRKTTDNKDESPALDVTAALKITKWGSVGVGAEDVLVKPGFTTTVRLAFEDDDIAYLLGLVGLTSIAK
jgi:phospholipid/cholesterol/gamma-HCH transport system substrate-binding protein